MKFIHSLEIFLATSTLILPLDLLASQTANASPLKILMPLYSSPNKDSSLTNWDEVAQAASSNLVEITAIINPATGPGTIVDPNYAFGIQQLQSSGVHVLGYVDTGFNQNTPRTVTDIEEDVTVYKNFYPTLEGIFFDQISAANDLNLWKTYNNLYQSTKTQFSQSIVVGNLGVQLPDDYFTWEQQMGMTGADVWVVSETFADLWPSVSLSENQMNNSDRFSVLLHSANVNDIQQMENLLELTAERGLGYAFITDDNLIPNPWDNLPSYWDEEVNYVAKINIESVPEPDSLIELLFFSIGGLKHFLQKFLTQK